MIGLYLNYFSPYPYRATGFARGSDALFLGRLTNLNSYQHQLDAIGGFISATIELGVHEQVAEDWLTLGLGRLIEVRDNYTNVAFRGVVDSLTLKLGDDTETRGPLFDIANIAYAVYTPRDFSVYPPVDGSTTVTLSSQNTDSQSRFGKFEKSTNAGTTTEDNAEKVRDVFLQEVSYPITTGNLEFSEAQGYSLTLNLVGNYSWFKAFIYNNVTPAIITVLDKLQAIMAADPNQVISAYDLWMEDNAYIVEQCETKDRFAWDIIAEMLSLGNDSDDRKRSFGVYEANRVRYKVAPTTAKYLYRLNDTMQCVRLLSSQSVVPPWMVRPGEWITVPDWLLGRKIYSPTALNQDPRNKYIETVSYSAPWQLSISGTPMDNLSRMLSKITYTGGIY